ncbi:hypothetical protein BMS3Abin03_02640 [bacterium BMS3Abin03]|nr:hypothetical protein BMS3Abin03_02640 [bacterium BMS3Abin03]HDZ58890.1 hypothetical protein [Ignavibacteriales bacterium]
MKKLFQNYNFEFSKNEKKLISSFCKQSLKQMEDDRQYFAEVKAFNSILKKIDSGDEVIKLTKDEKRKLTFQIKQNVEYIKKQMTKSWFIKKWLMKSLYNQYKNLFETHFKG